MTTTLQPQAAVRASQSLAVRASGSLIAGPADDTLIGGLGGELLTGGAGRDHFAYRSAGEGGKCSIKDFAPTEDSLDFFGDWLQVGSLPAIEYVAGVNFIADADPTSETGTFLFNTETHDLIRMPTGW